MSVYIWGKIFFPTEAPALTMEVVGHQFYFEFRYPGFKQSLVSPKDEMVLPVGRPVRILLSSSDVIHQFWVPDFRLKLATVPGLVQDMNFTPLRTGTYDIVCSEYCGLLHSHMQGKVVVESQDVFDKWYSTHKIRVGCRREHIDPAGERQRVGRADALHPEVHGLPRDRAVRPQGRRAGTRSTSRAIRRTRTSSTASRRRRRTSRTSSRTAIPASIGTMPNSQANGLSPQDVADLTAYLVSLK